MNIVIAKDYSEMSRIAANEFAHAIHANPSCVMGLATGSTPIGMYECLVEEFRAGTLNFSYSTTFNLDEYCGIAPTDPNSYRYFMDENLFSHINIQPQNIHLPNGNASDLEKECLSYEDAIAIADGIDIQLLGLGNNGHIGFNEPACSFPVTTHVVDLAQSTIEANSRFFETSSDVPRQAITMGIGTIMKARKIVLLASGDGKADIVKRAFFGPVTPEVPASVLQLHRDVTVIVDDSAATKLD